MKYLIGLCAVSAVLFACAVGYYGYLGGFHDVKIERGAFGPDEIIYATHRGPYENIGEGWQQFQDEMTRAGIGQCDGMGIYLDPPDVPPQDLRSVLGCRTDTMPESEKAVAKENFPSFVLPRSDALLSMFPYKNYFSYILAPMKVYPEIEKVVIREGLEPSVGIELYGVMGESSDIRFVVPIGIDKSEYQPLYDAFSE